MPKVFGAFGTRTQAEEALARLRAQGFRDDQLALVSHADEPVGAPDDNQQRTDHAIDAATVGAAVGAVLGGALLGPVGAVLGGAAGGGGLLATLKTRGMTDEEADDYVARLEEGRYVVVVHTDDRAEVARAVLDRVGGEHVRVDR